MNTRHIIDRSARLRSFSLPVCAWCGMVAGNMLVGHVAAQEQAEQQPAARWRLTGVGSCTAAGCHGGGHPQQIVGSEYNVWISEDPHAKAYSTLFDDESQRIVQLLAGGSGKPVTPAHENPRCLACHSMTDAPARDELTDVVSDGVGCEACHGPAEGWLAVHYERPLGPKEREQLGMWDTDNLLVRTQICVRCHVGSPGREVNHELIAAGHPRLEFSMNAYLDALPKHWDEAEDRAKWGADFDALLWALGQACTSEAALNQSADRANRGENWPEFAEWSCAACHHDLANDAARQAAVAEQGNLSGRRIAWDTWNHFAARNFASDMNRAFRVTSPPAADIQNRLRELDGQMRNLSPNRRLVAEHAREAATSVAVWAKAIDNGRLDRSRLDALGSAIVARLLQADLSDWSTAAQTYDALASLQQSRLQYADGNTATNQALTQSLQQLYKSLAADRLTPEKQRLDSDQVRQQLIEIGKLLPAARSEP